MTPEQEKQLKDYNPRNWAEIVTVSGVLKAMRELDVAELSLDIPQPSGADLCIRAKR